MSVLEHAINIAKEAGSIIREAFYKNKSVSTKSCKTDLVTDTDQYVEKLINERILSKYPDHKFIGEETVAQGGKCDLTNHPTWIIDPIDGTTNFVNQFPFCCVSIGYYVNKEAAVGVVYNPITEQLFHAEKGKGSFLNDSPIHVSGSTCLGEALVLSDCWGDLYPGVPDRGGTGNLKNMMSQVRGFRSLGSAALHCCYVAMGSGDIFFEFGIHCWDFAAGALIVEEAGGVAMDFKGSEIDLMGRQVICSSSKKLAHELIAVVTPVDFPRD